nr:NAD(P)/FAD-dependent oxidoreductase [uncultured Blautia sp.]
MKKRVLIIGAGAAGLMAGIQAAEKGATVTVLEQNDRPGRKICATGNGRCNMTNLHRPEDAYRGTDPGFAEKALRAFSVTDTLDFFRELGICITDKKGWIYPRSGQAQSVVDVLCMKAHSLGVKIKTNQKVTDIELKDSVWKVHVEGWTYEGDRVILANGSRASSVAGSGESGYILAESLGHHIIRPLPALTALKCKGNFFKAWSGVRTEGRVTLYLDEEKVQSQQGELQLTDYGVSGIPVFQISRYAIRGLHDGRKAGLVIDFLPEMSAEELKVFWEQRKNIAPYKNDKELLTGIFPEKLIRVLVSRKDFLKDIKAFPLDIKDGAGFEQAQVCSGGVDTGEIDPCTMESRIIKGLYFAGELIDIDGTCGGYNLQWAWSSGAAAGIHAAGKEQK